MSLPSNEKVIRDSDFAKRIATAVENHSLAPSGHGRQRWLLRRMEELYGVKVSPEAVRKWFAGEARPRPSVMTQVAMALEVDEAWLSLGINPSATPREKRKQNALTNGAVNLVAAHIQLAGGNIAFPDDPKDGQHDLFAIVRGRQLAVTVKLGEKAETFKLSVPTIVKTLVAVIPTDKPTVYDFIRVPPEVIDESSIQHGGYREIEVERLKSGGFKVGKHRVPSILSFDEL